MEEHTGLESLPEGIIADKEVLIRITEQLATVAARGRASINRLDCTDIVSQDILIVVVGGLAKHLWMFRSQLA